MPSGPTRSRCRRASAARSRTTPVRRSWPRSIQEGLEARRAGDEAEATLKLGRAVQLAAAGGNDGTLKLLRRVVEIDDPATGTVRLKRHVEEVDEMSLDTRSTKTVRLHSEGP